MCSSRRSPIERRLRPDWSDRIGSAAGLAGLLGLCGLLMTGWVRLLSAPQGEVILMPETQIRMELVPMPEVRVAEPEPEPEPEVEPEPEPLPEPEPESPVVEMPPEPEPEPEPEPVPEAAEEVEAMPTEAVSPVVEQEGASEQENAIRVQWLGELRRRIERSKFYPGAARYSRESGRVVLLVEITPDARIGAVRVEENSGSILLEEGALRMMERAGSEPLGADALPSGFQVLVPISYQMGRM